MILCAFFVCVVCPWIFCLSVAKASVSLLKIFSEAFNSDFFLKVSHSGIYSVFH